MKKNNGLIVSFYLDNGASDGQINIDKKGFPYLSWSPYDRIGMEEVDEFKEFFRSQFQESWNGIAQQIHLIPEYPEEISWEFDDSKKNSKKNSKKGCLINAGEKKFGLNCIVTVRFREAVAGKREYRERIYEKIKEIAARDLQADSGEPVIDWSAFISLGSEDVVFIVLADDIHTFARFINILKQAKIVYQGKDTESLIISVSSFVGFNRKDWSGNPQADLHIRLILRSFAEMDQGNPLEKIKEELPFGEFRHLLLGNNIYDVKFKSSDDLLTLFHDKHVFNGTSDFYKKYILSSRSYWEIIGDDSVGTFMLDIKDEIVKESSVFAEKMEEEEDFKIPMAQFILKEFQRLIVFKESTSWKSILERQYEIVRKLIKEYSEKAHYELMYSLIRQTQNVLQHIRQATTPIAQIPYRNYTYAGSYNDILKMYYSIISDLLQLGFELPHDAETRQYEIVFSVDFESTAKVHSTMYYSAEKDYNKRFVVFHLPFDAFVDIPTTVYLLTHEIFHYIAPYDREKRNKAIIQLWAKGIFLRTIRVLQKECELDKETAGRITADFFGKSDLFENIWKDMKAKTETAKSYVSNDFFTNSSNEKVFYEFGLESCDKILGEILKAYGEKFSGLLEEGESFDTVMQHIAKCVKSKEGCFFDAENMQVIAKALKEAFCDINMIQIYGLDIKEYLNLFFGRYFSKLIEKNESVAIDWFGQALKAIRVTSFEKRLGIVFDYFGECSCNNVESIYSSFEKRIDNIEKGICEKDCKKYEVFKKFLEYCKKCYYAYLAEECYYRETYEELYYSSMTCWKEEYDSKEKVRKLREVKCLDDNIASNAKFISQHLQIARFKAGNPTPIKYERSRDYGMDGDPYRREVIHSLGEFIDEACKIADGMREEKIEYDECCWYRGFCSKEFTLLPNLFRGDMILNSGLSPYAFQTKKLKEAYLATLSRPDLWTDKYTGIPEHICCLQHYGMKTNLLDFSLDMLVALHFALNPDSKDDRKKLDEGRYTPKVVIFNPVRYSKAVQCLRAGRFFKDEYEKVIPNTMFGSSSKELEEFFVSDISAEYANETIKKMKEQRYIPNRRVDKYPKPVIIRHSNDRIKAQSGTFVAFNLFSEMDFISETGKFDYLKLENIERDYLDLIPHSGEEEKERFLKTIYIDPACVKKIRKELKVMGIVTPKMYPELNKVFLSREE